MLARGHSDFAALRTNRGAAQASFVAYDLLQFQGENWRSMPLEVRRAQLESVVDGIDGITFSVAIEGDGATVFDHACRLGLEGIVSKRPGRPVRERALPELAEGQEPCFRAAMIARPFLLAPPGALSADAALPPAVHGPRAKSPAWV
jgi:hypothetical protein